MFVPRISLTTEPIWFSFKVQVLGRFITILEEGRVEKNTNSNKQSIPLENVISTQTDLNLSLPPIPHKGFIFFFFHNHWTDLIHPHSVGLMPREGYAIA